MVPLATATAKALKTCGSSWASAPPAGSSRAERSVSARRRIIMLASCSLEVDIDGVAAHRDREPAAPRAQADLHAVGVLQPHLARALVAGRHAVARLHVGAGELLQLLEIVDIAIGLHLGDAEAADAQAADREAVALALVMQRAAADIAAADEGDLDLLDLDRAALVLRQRRGDRQSQRPRTP